VISGDLNLVIKKNLQVLATPDGNPIHLSGSIYSFAAPRQIPSKEVGRWNTFEIKAIYQSCSVILNNTLITEFVGNRSLKRYIGLQYHDRRWSYTMLSSPSPKTKPGTKSITPDSGHTTSI